MSDATPSPAVSSFAATTSVTDNVVPFPPRRTIASVDQGQERLERALEELHKALAGQRAAVAAWRGAIGDLGRVVTGLGDSLQRYRSNLDTLGTRVAGLNAQAVELERTADAAAATVTATATPAG